MLQLAQAFDLVTSFRCVYVAHSSWQVDPPRELGEECVPVTHRLLRDVHSDSLKELVPVLQKLDNDGVIGLK